MKFTININQLAIIENELNIKGTTLDTWALFDFLLFFNGAKNHKTLNRIITKKEYDEVINYAISLGIENAFIQEDETQKESFIPSFNNEGI